MTETIVQQETKQNKVNTKKSKYRTSCPECKEVLPRGSFCCPQCDPPGIDIDEPLSGLTGFQAFLRIGAILSIFLAIAFYKLDLSVDNVMQVIDPGSSILAPSDALIQNNGTPVKDADFAITNFINTNNTNIRSKPTAKSVVVMKAKKGELVELLERREKWSKVKIKGKKGWVSNRLLSSEVREVP